jgi:mannan endo-1,4-beta-mannosidase
MRRPFVSVCAAMLAGALSVGAAPASAAAGLHVEGGKVVERNGRDFVMRGVNVPHAWFPSRTPQALTDVKALGAMKRPGVSGDSGG